jgi:hypothetical protein
VPAFLSISRTDSGGVEHSRAALLRALKSAAVATVEHWHETMMPKHFTVQGFDEYHYQLRKGQDEPNLIYSDNGRAVRMGKYGRLINNPKYYWFKWRYKGTHDPLVFTGESRDRAMRSIRTNATLVAGTTVRGSGVLDLPRYFYQYNKAQNAPDKADELFRTTSREEVALLNYFNDHTARALSADTASTTRQRVA